ncbi:ribonuclease H-like YkuK family protein [Pseudothermotoga sp.]|nr:ribonuclease H-like YkuK family protein [Pseudothermotoga sp.]MCX7813430.1 ribonuclease H-like YkuK family protein [Pseudothermotoga sp.]MDW8139582.1 ribonuclease H-like YkuK family protein [Pseudothermotoga sp.]
MYIEKFLNGDRFKLFIGTDSDDRDGVVTFATVFIVYKLGVGAIYFYTIKRERRYYDVYSRIFEETHLSLQMADFVKRTLNLDSAEIHIDAGYEGPSKQIIPSIVGYIKGMGYSYRLKPWAFAATKIAHRHTK